eukprot:TRINITY_DN60589_c0_g1_i1.p1 TRINITY_DN60589_c0_g1~~TRINITY_DN60589_c0_g1_i1.p1  ORF type:complete len:1487 (+),score=327.44 TRINITY_DN60589_c0_g1_i1:93-4463(+)
MCRMAVVLSAADAEDVLLADIVTRPRMSIIRQSFAARERAKMPKGQIPHLAYQQHSLNGDGYGVGWYPPRSDTDRTPCVFTSLKPAWNDKNIENLAEKTRSHLVFAHLRAAGPGSPVGEGMCHPFRAGRFLWMHNGCLVSWDITQRRFIELLDDKSFQVAMYHGGIDSVIAFALFLTELGKLCPERSWLEEYSPAELVEAMNRTIGVIIGVHRQMGVAAGSLMNFVLSDGDKVIASRVVDGGLDFCFDPASSACSEAPQSPSLSCQGDDGDDDVGSPMSPQEPLPPLTLQPAVAAEVRQAGAQSDYHAAERRQAASLYLSTGSRWVPTGLDGRDYRMSQSNKCNGIVIISSEPLSMQREEWMPIPTNHITICMSHNLHVDILTVPTRASGPTGPAFRTCLDLLSAAARHCSPPHAGGLSATSSASDIANHSHTPDEGHGLVHVRSWAQLLPPAATEVADRRRNRRCAEDSMLLSGHAASVTCMVSCCGGDVLVSGGQDGALRIWSLPLSQCCEVRRHPGPVLALAYGEGQQGLVRSQAGASQEMGTVPPLLFSSSSNELRIWDLSNVQEQASVPLQEQSISNGPPSWPITCLFILRFEPHQGRLLSLCGDSQALFLGFQSGAVLRLRMQAHWEDWGRFRSRSKSVRHLTVNLHNVTGPASPAHSAGDGLAASRQSSSAPGGKPKRVCSPKQVVRQTSHMRRSAPSDAFNWVCGHPTRAGWIHEDADSSVVPDHFGFVYALCRTACGLLVSGGADGRLILWSERSEALAVLVGHTAPVFALRAGGQHHVLSGGGDGTVRHWHIKSRSCTRTLYTNSNYSPVLSLAVSGSYLLHMCPGQKQCTVGVWQLDQQSDQAVVRVPAAGSDPALVLVTRSSATSCRVAIAGDMKGNICVTEIPLTDDVETTADMLESSQILLLRELSGTGGHTPRSPGSISYGNVRGLFACERAQEEAAALLRQLRQFVALRTITSDALVCESAAQWLADQCESLGATVKVQRDATRTGSNPIVLGRLGWDAAKPTVILYAHYDVVPPGRMDMWKVRDGPTLDPWSMNGHQGYVYGRGVSDNKGPMLVQLAAVRRLQKDGGQLPCNVVFLYEGDGESRSRSHISNALKTARERGWLAGVMGALSCNGSWIVDDRPSLCLGSRGLIDLEVRVSGPGKELHTGMHGGFVAEPMHDLLAVCGQLVDASGMIMVPDIYDGVRGPSATEERALKAAAECFESGTLQKLELPTYHGQVGGGPCVNVTGATWQGGSLEFLRRTWLQPSLSITGIDTSADCAACRPADRSSRRTIAREAIASVVFRTVPDQASEQCADRIERHLKHEFAKRRSPNTLTVARLHTIPWWQADQGAPITTAVKESLRQVWGTEPLCAREGSSLRTVPVLQEELQMPCAMLPLGQASDGQHQPAERMRVLNLMKGVDVVEAFLRRASRICPAPAVTGRRRQDSVMPKRVLTGPL